MSRVDPHRWARRFARWGRSPGTAAVWLLAGLGGGAEPAEAQRTMRVAPGAISGKVTVAGTDDGLRDVEVRLVGTSFQAVTDQRGVFRIDPAPTGDHRIRFSRLGYQTRTDTISLPIGAVLELTAALSTEPIQLEGLEVTVRSAVLERAGFYGRQSQGYQGYFLDRPDIERRQPDTMTDLFQRMSGLRVVHGGLYGSRILMNSKSVFSDHPAGCEPSIWIDGIRSTMRSPDIMRVDELEGLEVYTGAGSPGKFNDLCGVIVIWTRQRINR